MTYVAPSRAMEVDNDEPSDSINSLTNERCLCRRDPYYEFYGANP